jgi:adenylate cyclase
LFPFGGFFVWGVDPVNTEEFKRKLTAILSADVEGYSRLMGEDEDATVRKLKAYLELITEVIQNYRGRVVDSPGDNLLAEFGSVVDAVRCAVEIQKALKSRNAELRENKQMKFRIGVNLGDVIADDERIYGDGVNIAARLEGIADGGGICISGTVFDSIENKLALEFQSLGEHSVKNIVKPIRVYRVLFEHDTALAESSSAFDLPDKPSIAVLPFINMSGDPEQEYFSDGITEEIITGLSKIPKMFIIARNSTFTYKGTPVKVQKVAKDLSVRYVLEGSVRRAGDRVRITAQLIDALNGYHLWAERYDRTLKDIFAVQDEITKKIITALQVKLTEGEQASHQAKGTDNLEAYLKFLQGHYYWQKLTPDDNVRVRQLAEEIIALDPEYPKGYLLLGLVNLSDAWFGLSKAPNKSIEQVLKFAQKVISLDDSDPDGYFLLGGAYLHMKQHEKSIAARERALALNPNHADYLHVLGTSLLFAGRPQEAIPLMEKSIRFNPIPPNNYLPHLAHAYQDAGLYEEAIAACKKAIHVEPDNLGAHLCLTSAYVLLGHEEEARATAEGVLKIEPKFSLEHLSKMLPYKNQVDSDRHIDALRKAGLK